jgi:hypothetical protein
VAKENRTKLLKQVGAVIGVVATVVLSVATGRKVKF